MYKILNANWLTARDPENRGRDWKWQDGIAQDAQPAPVPGIIQQIFPDYHGVVWYWTTFRLPRRPENGERILLRFGAVDYLAEVWVNGQSVGGHEGGETPFELDATAAIAGDAGNLLAVRVLNPTDEPIDGIRLAETPHRNKLNWGYQPGWMYNHGGILRPVELRLAPPFRLDEVFVKADLASGRIDVETSIRNDSARTEAVGLELTVAAAGGGVPLAAVPLSVTVPPGSSTHRLTATLSQPHAWSVEDPFLYTAVVRLASSGPATVAADARVTRFGFRDFRVEDGFFLLNGKRLFLKSTHTGNHFPIGQAIPLDPDFMRRDMLYAKACGFNTVRFIAGLAWPEQLDCCDEIGLMVYEESHAGWCLEDSPRMKERFDRSTREMIRRDRNHPCLTIWGLLNETRDSPVFRHAVESLGWVRDLDDTRLILLNSGRFDCDHAIGSLANPGSRNWEHQWGVEAPGQPTRSWPVGAQDAGDFHLYPPVPLSAESETRIRSLGKGTKPVFLSEFGTGSLFNLIDEDRGFEAVGSNVELPDRALIQSMRERFLTDWERHGMTSVYPFPEDFFRDSYRLHVRERRRNFDLLRANPNLCGHNLTGMLDHALTGEGLWTFWREWKPRIAEALRDGWAPLRWCLFVSPEHGYCGRGVGLEAVLANEDILPPGEYPVSFRVFGPAGLAWEKRLNVSVPAPAAGQHGPLAIPVLKEQVVLNGPAGEYTFAASLERGGAAQGDRATFRLAAPESFPKLDTEVTVFGLSAATTAWLEARGIRCRPLTGGAARRPETILVGTPETAGLAEWRELVRRVARGGTAVFLQPEALRRGGETTAWLPLHPKGTWRIFNDWLYHKECVAKSHPVFAGLQAAGIMDWSYYGHVTPAAIFEGLPTPDETIAAAFATGSPTPGGYASGLLLGAYRFHAGRLILNTLRIVEELDGHPAADRLLLNLIGVAREGLPQRLAPAPADLDDRIGREIYPPDTMSDFVKSWRLTAALPEEPPARDIPPPAAGVVWSEPRNFTLMGGGFVDFYHISGKTPGLVYAEAAIDVPRAMEVELLLGTDGPLKIWIGGQEVVVVETATNPMVPDAYRFPLKLAAGPQSVRVGFCRRGGAAWGFILRFRRPDRPWTAEELRHRQTVPSCR